METMGVDSGKNTAYTRGIFAIVRNRLAPHGAIDFFNHLDLQTDPFSVKLALSQRTQGGLPIPATQRLSVTLVAFLPNRSFLLHPLLDDHPPGVEFVRSVASTYTAVEGTGFPHHRDLWMALARHAPRVVSCALHGRMNNAIGLFDALEAAYTESCPPALLQTLEKVVLENVDFDPDVLNSSAFFEAGSSFWSVLKRRSPLRVVFKGCFIPDSVEELLSCSEKVTVSSK